MSKLRMPHPATMFFLLTLAVILLSWIFDVYGLSVLQPQTGEEIRVQSLLSPEGIRWLLRHVREAPSLYFVPKLQEMKAKLRAWDPVAEEKFKEIHPELECVPDLYECAKGADLLLILTEWDEFRKLTPEFFRKNMKKSVIVDGRRIYDGTFRAKVSAYRGIGLGPSA